LLLLALAAGAVVSAFVLGRTRIDDGAAASFVCPMHPEVTSKVAADCPICRMALEQVTPASRPGDSDDAREHKVVGRAERRPVTLEIRAPAWLETGDHVAALLYRHDLGELASDEPGTFFRASAPTAPVRVRRSSEPPTAWDDATSRVRFRLDLLGRVKTGEAGWVKLAAKTREYLVVPSSAVLYSSEGPYVLVPAASGPGFDRRHVAIGRVTGGVAVVGSGLRDGEPIAVSSTFFLDAERRLQSERKKAQLVP
jgi:hypothetical protein